MSNLIGSPFEKIGDWTSDRLARFIAQRLHQDPPSLPSSQDLSRVRVAQKLTVDGDIQLSPQAVAYIKKAVGL